MADMGPILTEGGDTLQCGHESMPRPSAVCFCYEELGVCSVKERNSSSVDPLLIVAFELSRA